MGKITNAGLILLASAQQTAGVNAAYTYVAIGTGCGTLASALVSGNAYTTLTLDAALPADLADNTALLLYDGTNSQPVIVNGAALTGATSITVDSFTASHNFAAHTTGLVPTPTAGALTLFNETVRVGVSASVAGATAGESLTSGYFDGTQATAVYLEVGYFGGATASSALASGTLVGIDTAYWNHVVNVDTNMFQADSLIAAV